MNIATPARHIAEMNSAAGTTPPAFSPVLCHADSGGVSNEPVGFDGVRIANAERVSLLPTEHSDGDASLRLLRPPPPPP
ncbi:MAG: hypothetical protein LBR07_03555, partial [Puniceicoccales bacterium]|nr:hypothetical protein [Puniceicoccales bacterium]